MPVRPDSAPASFFMPGGAPAAGWTLYAPLTLQMRHRLDMDAGILAVHILGAVVDHGGDQHHRHHLNMRAPGMTLMKMPLFVWTWLITAYLLIAVMPVLAGVITMTADRPPLRHQLLRRRRRRRPGDVPAHLLVLRPPRGVHHDPAGLRHHQPDHSGLRPQETVRLRLDGVCHRRASPSCRSSSGRTTCSPPACRWHGQLFFMYATMLIAVPTGVKVFNWVATHVARLDDLRDAHAVLRRLHLRVHHGRLHRPDPGHRPDRHPAAGHLLRRGSLPLRAGGRLAVRIMFAGVYYWSRSGPATCSCTTKPAARSISGGR
jgi:hypothetical protein